MNARFYYLDEKKMFILQPNFMMSFCKKGLFSRIKALNQLAVVLSSKDGKLSTDDFAQNLAFQEKEKKTDNC